jgi:predicted transcriptional regulator
MTAFQVELDDALASEVEQDAKSRGVPVSEVIRIAVQQVYAKPLSRAGIEPGKPQSFEEAIEATLRENDELYRRLAQ